MVFAAASVHDSDVFIGHRPESRKLTFTAAAQSLQKALAMIPALIRLDTASAPVILEAFSCGPGEESPPELVRPR
jgi:hypothetical protein